MRSAVDVKVGYGLSYSEALRGMASPLVGPLLVTANEGGRKRTRVDGIFG
jgi:hypothetical protein